MLRPVCSWFLAALCLLAAPSPPARQIRIAGLRQPVEILRDRWGVPHIYAQTQHDLFFAQGWIAAHDRLFQIDLWRRANSGMLAEVLGPTAVERDRFARLVRYRGDRNTEWLSYAADARQIATSFTAGINAYIRALGGRRPVEFERAGYSPGVWAPEDCLGRLPGLVMSQNVIREINRAADIQRFGIDVVRRMMPPDPPVAVQVPAGVDLDIPYELVRFYQQATLGLETPPEIQGSNNWVVDGTWTASGKPLLASDPHRPLLVPSLRKTVHLVGPGWNAIGAGEPALPGIALGHNENIGFGFTIAGIDQQDLYVERTNPQNPGEYWHKGAWRRMEVERQAVAVKGERAPRTVELRYTVHGPVLYEQRDRRRAFALRWVGFEAGGAGYLAALSAARARNWSEFSAALARFHTPSENMLYADRQGNIGWRVAGLTPVRPGWHGLLPAPGDGSHEWAGFLPAAQLPSSFNPPAHFLATANNKILPPGYDKALSYEWGAPYRVDRIREMITAGGRKFTVEDFARMQYDVVSLPARRFQAVVRRWQAQAPRGRMREMADRIAAWDCRLAARSPEALLYAIWFSRLPQLLFGSGLGLRVDMETVLRELEAKDHRREIESALDGALRDLDRHIGANPANWFWGRTQMVRFTHPLRAAEWSIGPLPVSGDGFTVHAIGTAGGGHISSGASYRQILDLANWDRSVMTNVPGESGDPASPHYRDLVESWSKGAYHAMPYTRRAVEAATEERIVLNPST